MKHLHFTILLAVLMSMAGAKAWAYDIAVENEDGITLYYNYINEGRELEVYGVKENVKGVLIPETVVYKNRTRKVTRIAKGAFSQMSNLTILFIPYTVTSIGGGKFENLKEVHISDIGSWCNIEYDKNASSPLHYAHHLFVDGEEVKDLVIPNSVTSIGNKAFQGCSNLTSVTIPNTVKSIGDQSFSGCSSLTSLIIPNSVTTIGEYAFSYCYGLTSVTFGNSVTSIGSFAFQYCTSLNSVTIPNSVTSIGGSTFYHCIGLTSITIPNSVTSIGSIAFRECSSLTSVTIGNSVREIGHRAFQDCFNITDVVSLIEMPFKIDSDTFAKDVKYNATLYVPKGTVEKYKSTEGWDFTFIEEGVPAGIETNIDVKQIANAYSVDGQLLIKEKKGINIIKMSDGTTKKVLINK
ncbi:MAG: leucine-rich repeat protein [Prevotella sp.]|nr:leucine-rich repeat protein [Prevotella sp.]